MIILALWRLVSGALSRIGRSEHGGSEAKLAHQICGNEPGYKVYFRRIYVTI